MSSQDEAMKRLLAMGPPGSITKPVDNIFVDEAKWPNEDGGPEDMSSPRTPLSFTTKRQEQAVSTPKINKYTRFIGATQAPVDVYDVLLAFGVEQPAIQHALKKMLAPGQRGVKEEIQDVKEAIQSLERALEQMQYSTGEKS